MTGITAAICSLWVLMMMMASTANARVINKRAAFYIANDTMCIVDGEVYFNGDPVPTDDHCEKCTCRPPGFSCVLRDCDVKPGCKAVRKDGECCPDYICGCSHNGNVYKDGDFIRDLQNPCYTCRCHGSSISCTFADCLFRSDCGPEYVQGECCPRYDHCPPLSTTQKSTTVITTVPITYDETTMPLFNLTSPPQERQATHTTIFPTTGTVTLDGEAETTGTYGTQGHSLFTLEPAHTIGIFDHTVASSSDIPEDHISHVDASTVTSERISEESSQVYDTSSHEVTSDTGDETDSTSFTSDAMFSEEEDDAVVEDEFNDLSTDSTAEELSTETHPVTEVSVGSSTTSVAMSVEGTMESGETTVRLDEISADETTVKTDETTLKTDETTVKTDETTVKTDETTVKTDETTTKSDESTMKSEETTMKAGETTLEYDEIIMEAEETTLKAEGTTSKAEGTALKAEGTTLKAEGTTLKAEGTTLKAKETTLKDEGTTLKAEGTTLEAEGTTLKAEETTLKAEETTLKTEETTLKAEETTLKAKETTLKAEETTLKAEETTLKAEETTLKADDTTRIPFLSEEPLKVTSDITEMEETFSPVEGSKDGVFVTTADMVTSKDLITPSGGEDESYSQHETFSLFTEVEEISKSTTPSPLSTVTMSGDSDTEFFPFASFATTEVDDTAADKTQEDSDVSEAPSSAITPHHDSQTKSDIKDEEILSSTEHSDFPESVPSSTPAETKSHTFSTGTTDQRGHTDGFIDEDEISTQDAEELDSFLEEVISSLGSTQSESTVFEGSSLSPPKETAHTQSVPTEQHTDSHKHITTEQPFSDHSNDWYTEKTSSSDEKEEEDIDSLLSSILEETETKKPFNETGSTTELLLDHDHTVSEPEIHAAIKHTTQSGFDDQEAPQIVTERHNTTSVASEDTESAEILTTTTIHGPKSPVTLITSSATSPDVSPFSNYESTTNRVTESEEEHENTEKTSNTDEKEEEDIDSLLSSILEETETKKEIDSLVSSILEESETKKDIHSLVSLILEESESEKLFNETGSTTELLPDHDHTLSESETDVAVKSTTQSGFSNQEAPQILTDRVNTTSVADVVTIQGEEIHTDDYTESVVIMEAETDSSFITSEGSPTMPSDTVTIKTSFKDSESLEILTTTIRDLKSPVTTITSSSTSPDISPSSNYVSTTNHAIEGTDTESEEHENIPETSHFQQDNVIGNVTEISSDDFKDYEANHQVGSTHLEADQFASTKSGTSDTNEGISENEVTVYSTEVSDDPKIHNTIAPTTGTEETETSSEKQLTDEIKFTDANDQAESSVPSTGLTPDDFIEAEGTHDEKKDRDSEKGLNSTPQVNTDNQATETIAEITMDAEENIVNHSFETATDYHFTTESVETNYFSTTEDITSLGNEHSDTVNRYTLDGETSDDHLRVSRSTSLNIMSSSATERYPEEPELQHSVYPSETEKEGTEVVENTQSSALVSDNTAVTKSITFSAADENLDPTHSTYSDFAKTASPGSDEDFPTTANNREHEHAANQTAHEIMESSLGDTHYNANKTDMGSLEETSDDEKLLSAFTTVSSVLFDPEETVKPTSTDVISGLTQNLVTDPAATTTEINGVTSALEKTETEREHISQNYFTNSDIERESDEDVISRFSRTSERYATSDPVEDGNDSSDSSTENQPTMSSFTMDAGIMSLDDITERNVEQAKEQTADSSTWNTQESSEPTNVFEHEDIHSQKESDSGDEFVGKDFESGPEKGGELFEPTLPILSAIDGNQKDGRHNSSDSEEGFVGKEFQSGPEKGGELFEPTVPVLSIINVQKDETETSLGDLTTTVGYSTSTNLKTDVSLKTDETPHHVDKTNDQDEEIRNSANLYHSTLFSGEAYSELTTTVSHVDKIQIDNKYTGEFIPHEITTPDDIDDLEHHINEHEPLHFSTQEEDLKANEPIDEKSVVNEADTTVSAKLTFSATESAGDSSDKMNVIINKENDEVHENAADERLEHESGEATTTEKYFSPARDEMGSTTKRDTEQSVVTRDDELEELTNHSQREAENAGVKATKEPDILANEHMLSDWSANETDFTDVILQEAEAVTDHASTTTSTAPEEEEKGLGNANEEFTEEVISQMQNTDNETTDEDEPHSKVSREEHENQNSNTTSANGNTAKESGAPENIPRDSELSSEKIGKNSTSTKDHSEDEHHESDDAHISEHASTYFSISTTPWPILVHGLTEQLVVITETDRSSHPETEQQNTVQTSKSGDVPETESISSAKAGKDSEKQDVKYDISASDEHESITMTLLDSNPASSSSSEHHEQGMEEFHITTFPSEEETSQSSNSDSNMNESEKKSEATGTEAPEMPQKSENNVPPVFLLRVSHDYPSEGKQNSISATPSEHHEGRKDVADVTTFSPKTEISHGSNLAEARNLTYGSSVNESERNSDTTGTEATETTQKSEKKVPPRFVLRVSHDNPPESREVSEEESAVPKDSESYSLKSSTIVVESPDDTIRGEEDQVADSAETNQLAQEVTDNNGDYHETSLSNSPKFLNSVETITTVSPAEKEVVITTESSKGVTFSSQSVEDVQDGEVGHLGDGQISDTA